MVLRDTETGILAARILAAFKMGKPLTPINDAEPAFDLTDAYAISAAVTERRVKRGEVPIGWKIGFTNRTIWDEYGVHAPIWGPMYDTTVTEVAPGAVADCSLAALMEPRIEPEIVFRVATAPEPGMDGADLLACLDGVAHGFEIVQSLYPDWKFTAADTVAAFALHGRLYHRPFVPLDREWQSRLLAFEIALSRDGAEIDRGRGENVLGGPVSALAHFIRGLDQYGGGRLTPGDIVTTGTVTRAFPVQAGEMWSTAVSGLPLEGMAIVFR